MVYDYKGDPIYYNTDTVPQKMQKFLAYELSQAQPISTSSAQSSLQRGVSTLKTLGTSYIGAQPTTSEDVKDVKAIRTDLFDLQKATTNKQIELNKLVNENKSEAVKEAKIYNAQNKAKLDQIFKGKGTSIPQTEFNKYQINNLKPTVKKQGTTIDSLFKK